MEIIIEKNKFYALSSYDERDIPKTAGFRWSPQERVWWTADWRTAKKLKKYCAPEAVRALTAQEAAEAAEIQASQSSLSTISVPAPAGLTYLPYQLAGIDYAVRRENCLIADEMGLGKTIQAIGIINYTRPTRVLIVCPAVVKINWQRELQKWLVVKTPVTVVNGNWPPEDRGIIIINYDILSKYVAQITAAPWDIVIYDESHYLKNPKTARTKIALSIPAVKRLFLTGTPILNRPVELHPILRAAGVDWAQNWFYFVRRYCAGKQTKWGWDVSGTSNQTELGEKLRASIMVRRQKADVLLELPEKRREIFLLPANGASAEIAAEKSAWEKYEQKTAAARATLAACRREKQTDTEDYRLAVAGMKTCLADFAEIARLRHQTALKKVPTIVDITAETVDSAGCVVVFAHHTDVIDGIIAGLTDRVISAEKITGETPVEKRQEIIDRFQAGKIHVLVGSTRACGVGITLTRASNVIFTELDWTPAAISQAEDRLHRIGQKNAVLVQLCVYDNSIDSLIAKKIVEKEEIIEEILEDIRL